MRKLLWISLAFWLVACSGDQETSPPIRNATSSGNFGGGFDDTRLLPEEKFFALASAALKRGKGLDSPRAERCWIAEENRPVIRAVCSLLWATSQEPSALLEKSIGERAPRERIYALALAVRKTLVSDLPITDLHRLLVTLDENETWVKAWVVKIWLSKNAFPSRQWQEKLLPQLQPSANPGPFELVSSLTLFYQFMPAEWQAQLAQYCDADARGEARIRCWRLIGALATAEMPPGMAAELGPFLPAPSDPDWKLFTLSFPPLAFSIHRLFF